MGLDEIIKTSESDKSSGNTLTLEMLDRAYKTAVKLEKKRRKTQKDWNKAIEALIDARRLKND